MSLQVCVEEQRFEKLMEHFRNEDNNIDFMVGSSAPFSPLSLTLHQDGSLYQPGAEGSSVTEPVSAWSSVTEPISAWSSVTEPISAWSSVTEPISAPD